jgi:hypothetical protein
VDDVGAIQGGQELGIALETGRLRIARHPFGEDLSRDSRSSLVSMARHTSPKCPSRVWR